MRKIVLFGCMTGCFFLQMPELFSQKACSQPAFHQFDFWIGTWEVYGQNGAKAGTSKVTAILDSCVILEEWTSTAATNGVVYAGKSFNKYNPSTGQWQQTWVDNQGGSVEFLQGQFTGEKMEFLTAPFRVSGDTMAIRKLCFYPLQKGKLRQHGEISKNGGISWSTEYDLEYRRKN